MVFFAIVSGYPRKTKQDVILQDNKMRLYCGFSTISLAVRINDPASIITEFPKSGRMETGRELGGCLDNQTNRCILATGTVSQNASVLVPQNQPISHRHEFILSFYS